MRILGALDAIEIGIYLYQGFASRIHVYKCQIMANLFI